eukprot:TRINITY_DN11893_c0_g1_i3.p2 TRINITY_DN11893_c0_g1~~TRINITY_DN11893_c0_g1_i3.p2  ORF type:complete len:206 (-),score=13.59 TRINITY_DN11893_c0_g1_i3:104-721(-)
MGGARSRNLMPCCLRRDLEYQEPPLLYSQPPGFPRHDACGGAVGSRAMPGVAPVPQPPGAMGYGTGPCIVCRDNAANTICLPCGHLLVCFRCSLRYSMPDGGLHPDTSCPLCRQSVRSFQRVLLQSPALMERLSSGAGARCQAPPSAGPRAPLPAASAAYSAGNGRGYPPAGYGPYPGTAPASLSAGFDPGGLYGAGSARLHGPP